MIWLILQRTSVAWHDSLGHLNCSKLSCYFHEQGDFFFFSQLLEYKNNNDKILITSASLRSKELNTDIDKKDKAQLTPILVENLGKDVRVILFIM